MRMTRLSEMVRTGKGMEEREPEGEEGAEMEVARWRAKERWAARDIGAKMSDEDIKRAADSIMKKDSILMHHYGRGLEAASSCMLTTYKRKGKGFWVIEGAIGAAASISAHLSEEYYALPDVV